MPRQLTVGVADEFLGQLTPDGKRLYFVSTRNIANEIYWQNVEDGHAALLFDEGADVTWPRLSPDGKSLLYISFRNRADGQLCIRDLPEATGRRCLENGNSALQAEWRDAKHILLLSSVSVEGDLRLLEVTVGGHLTEKPLLQRNLSSPAVSPDGRWLVYVPVERYVPQVGPAFAARAAPRLEAVRLDVPGATPVPLALDLPGLSSQPAFGKDGQLYLVQFFSDSNHDGVIDASDHGVLFRVPFPLGDAEAPSRAIAAMPEQLTDASWNCQYPAPAKDRLLTTCSTDSLDIFELPLGGEVGEGWSKERLLAELSAADSQIEELLLDRALLAKETDVSARRLRMMRLVALHLQLDEFSVAEFYVRHIHALRDSLTHGLSHALFLQIAQREAVRNRERGRMADDFAKESRARLQLLLPRPGDSAAALLFAHVVRSEIEDSLGNMAEARRELERADLDATTPPAVLEAYYDRADALYRELDDPAALLAVCRRLAASKAFSPAEQLRFARAAVRARVRGLPLDAAAALLMEEQKRTPTESEFGFALELAAAVNAVRDANPSHPVREALMALYHRQSRADRRRALVVDAVERATDTGADKITEGLADAYVGAVPEGTEERRRAEDLYRRTLLGRGYRRLAEGHLAGARADFDAVTRQTGSFESAIAAINLRMHQGESPTFISAQYAPGTREGKGLVGTFVRAYLLARELPRLRGEAHAQRVTQALAELRQRWTELKSRASPQVLFGAILHERYLQTGDLSAAERANVHYLIGMQLAREEPRYRAMVLGQLGLLQTQLGNFRVAVGYLKAREALPFADAASALSVRMAWARVLLHVGREADAAKAADEAMAMVAGAPELQPFSLLVLDRAALYNLAASHFERALSLYDVELPQLERQADAEGARNRLRVRLARAAAALGAENPSRALADLDLFDRDLNDKLLTATLHWPHSQQQAVIRSYRLIAAGLRANANRKLGRLLPAEEALKTRRALFLESLAHSERDEDLRAVILVEARLAQTAAQRKASAAASQWIDRALDHADTLVLRTHGTVHPDQLTSLWFAAELKADAAPKIRAAFAQRLDQAYAKLLASHDDAWEGYERWFEIYIALLAP